MKFDEVMEFDDKLYQKNIADHTFPENRQLRWQGGNK